MIGPPAERAGRLIRSGSEAAECAPAPSRRPRAGRVPRAYPETMSHLAPPRPARLRTRLPRPTIRRAVSGGHLSDTRRLPRYVFLAVLGAAAIWAPVTGYVRTAPPSFRSEASLILPGSGAAASMNLNGIGQASSHASSAFSSTAVSPTETYKRLIGSDRILDRASAALGVPIPALGRPRVELVDRTGLIRVEMRGPAPAAARARTAAVLDAFFAEVDALRRDEVATRESTGQEAVETYRGSVGATRDAIARLQSETGLISAEQYHAQVRDLDALRERRDALAATLAERSGAVRAQEAMLGVTAPEASALLRVQADGAFAALAEELARAAGALSTLGPGLGPRHPRRLAMQAVHDDARARAMSRAAAISGLSTARLGMIDLAPGATRADLLAALVGAEAERRGIEAEWAALSERTGAEARRLAALAPGAARLEDLQRDFAVAEAIFASGIARTETGRADLYASYPLVQVLQVPSLPERPVSPDVRLAVAAGIAATAMLLIALSLGWIRRALIGRLLAAG